MPEGKKSINYDAVSLYGLQELSVKQARNDGDRYIAPIFSTEVVSKILKNIGDNSSYNVVNNHIYNISRYTMLFLGFLSFLFISSWYALVSKDEIVLSNTSNHQLQSFYNHAEVYDKNASDINSAIHNVDMLKKILNLYEKYDDELPSRQYFHRETYLKLKRVYERNLVEILTPYIIKTFEKELEANILNSNVNKVVSNLLFYNSIFSDNNDVYVELKNEIKSYIFENFVLDIENKERLSIILNDYMSVNKKLIEAPHSEIINKSYVFLQTKNDEVIYYELLKNRLSNIRYDAMENIFGSGFYEKIFTYSCSKLNLDLFNNSALIEIKKLIDKNVVKNDIEMIIFLKNGGKAQEVGEEGRVLSIYQSVLDKYFDDYMSKWSLFLKCTNVNTVKNIGELRKILSYFLTVADHPMISILKSIKSNTKITGLELHPESEEMSLNDKLLNSLYEKAQILENRFSGYYSFLGEEKENSFLMPLNLKIEDVYLKAIGVDESEVQGYLASQEFHDYLKGNHPINSIQSMTHHNNDFINTWINKIVSNWVGVYSNMTSRHINNQWKEVVSPHFTDTILSRFPFKESDVDVDMYDFTRYFAPDGVLNEFQRVNVKPFLNSKFSGYKSIHINGDYIQFMDWFSNICESCFVEKDIDYIFVKINSLSSQFTGFSLNNGISKIWYDHGPSTWQKLAFQSGSLPGDDLFVKYYHKDTLVKSDSFVGSWSLIKLLKKSKISFDKNHNVINVSYGDGDVDFQLKSDAYTKCIYKLSTLKLIPVSHSVSGL